MPTSPTIPNRSARGFARPGALTAPSGSSRRWFIIDAVVDRGLERAGEDRVSETAMLTWRAESRDDAGANGGRFASLRAISYGPKLAQPRSWASPRICAFGVLSVRPISDPQTREIFQATTLACTPCFSRPGWQGALPVRH
jgi:hypothetical protein